MTETFPDKPSKKKKFMHLILALRNLMYESCQSILFPQNIFKIKQQNIFQSPKVTSFSVLQCYN